MDIFVINASTRMDEQSLAVAVRAVAHQLHYDVAPAWGAKPVALHHVKDASLVPAGSYVITVYDDADQADALGYHTEDPDGTVHGKVFVSPVLDNGGTLLSGPVSVSAVLSHEVLETYIDPHVQLWAFDGQDAMYAYEICDSVEDLAYPVFVPHPATRTTVSVSVSDFQLPAYFDAQAPAGSALDHLRVLRTPFEITKGGYAVKLTLGASSTVEQVFGEQVTEWKKETKRHELSRLARRVKAVDADR